MERTAPLTDQLRDWYEHSPTAQRAYTRLRADVDTAMARVQPMMKGFWDRIGPIIDPTAKDATTPGTTTQDTASHTTPGSETDEHG